MSYPSRAHAERTLRELVRALPDADKHRPHVLLLAGERTPYRNDTDRELPFRQESNFFYLTGCAVPGAAALVVSSADGAGAPRIELFLPPIEDADLMWSVPPPTLDAARSMFDAHAVHALSALPAVLADLATPAALVHVLPQSALYPALPAPALASLSSSGSAPPSDAHLLDAVQRARLIKDAHELSLIRKANDISSRAHETVMRVLGAAVRAGKAGTGTGDAGADGKEARALLPGEWMIEREEEAEAIFVAACRRAGAVHQAYMPIVAGGGRASTLHYTCNCESLGPNRDALRTRPGESRTLLPQVLLIDAGCEWENYAADITRTMPVGNGGRFTPEARAIYELVHEMQRETLGAVKPGAHWDALQLLAHRVLVRGLQRLGIFKRPDAAGSGSWNSEDAILASGDTAAFFPHGLGHSLGLDVHDAPRASKPPPAQNITLGPGGASPAPGGHEDFYANLRLRLPLEAGMVVTVEPGCYFHPHLLRRVQGSKHVDHAVLARYAGMGGVRIEDCVLVTEKGAENLTTVRSDVEWVEGVCSGEL